MARPQPEDSMAVRLGGHQNKEWAENKNSFGFKMLQKMGWKEGNGLGKHEDGQNTHVRVKKRSELEEGLGIGAKIDMAGQAGWGKTAGGFDSLLQKLNKEYGGSAGGGKAKKAGQKKEGTKEERKAARKAERKAERKAARKAERKTSKKRDIKSSKVTRRGIFARKYLKNKDSSNYSAHDMAGILGVASKTLKEEKKKKKKKEPEVQRIRSVEDIRRQRAKEASAAAAGSSSSGGGGGAGAADEAGAVVDPV